MSDLKNVKGTLLKPQQDLRDHYDQERGNLWFLGLWEKFQPLTLKDMLV